jgi:outer membrane lipoprotein-sorting protein
LLPRAGTGCPQGHGASAARCDALRAIATLRADFVQSSDNGQQVSGTLSLKRPGKIRFQYQRGYPVQIFPTARR